MPIYEPEFLGFSYGFRPGRGAHDALDALAFGIDRRRVRWIVDADIRSYFDRINRDWLVRFLEHRIGDRRVIRLIMKWLNAGVMEGGEWRDDLWGTPQGAIVKTRLIEFGRFAEKNRRARGERRPETFDFLGFSVSSEGWHVQWETVPSG